MILGFPYKMAAKEQICEELYNIPWKRNIYQKWKQEGSSKPEVQKFLWQDELSRHPGLSLFTVNRVNPCAITFSTKWF